MLYRALYRLSSLISSINFAVHICHFTTGWGQNMPYTQICLESGKAKAVVQKGNVLSFALQNIS